MMSQPTAKAGAPGKSSSGGLLSQLFSSDRFTEIDRLVKEYHKRIASGESLSISQFVASHPAHAKELLAALRNSPAKTDPIKPGEDFLVGRMFGDYRVLSKLGQGGIGKVYRAVDGRTGQTVALKVLRSPDPQHVARFIREARMADLDHPNIVHVFDVGVFDDMPYVSMEHIPSSQSLNIILKERGKFTENEVMKIGLQVANALNYAHSQGVIHRDVKPSNILMQGEDVLLIDFDLMHIEDAELTKITASGEFVGTPAYMPPEQLEGRSTPSAKWDVYSLGATLYELLSGEAPFIGATAGSIMRKALHDDPPPLRNFGVSPAVEAICMRCLEKDPDKRYANAGEIADDIKQYLTGHTVNAPQINWPLRRIRRAFRERGVRVVMLVAALAACFAAIFLVRASHHREQVMQLRDLEGTMPPSGRDYSLDFLEEVLEEEQVMARMAAVNALFRRNTPEAEAVLAQAANDKDRRVRLKLASLYASRQNEMANDICMAFLDDESPAVQAAAIRLAAQLNLKKAGPKSRKLAYSHHVIIQHAALMSMPQILGRDFPEFAGKYLHSGPEHGRVFMLERIIKGGAAPPIDAVIRVLEAPSKEEKSADHAQGLPRSREEKEAAQSVLEFYSGMQFDRAESWRQWWKSNAAQWSSRVCVIIARAQPSSGLVTGDIIWEINGLPIIPAELQNGILSKNATIVRDNQLLRAIVSSNSFRGRSVYVGTIDGVPVGGGPVGARIATALHSGRKDTRK